MKRKIIILFTMLMTILIMPSTVESISKKFSKVEGKTGYELNDTVVLGGETFKIVRVDENTSLAYLTRFSKNGPAGIGIGSTTSNHYNIQYLLPGTPGSYVDEFNNKWQPKLSDSDKLKISRMAYIPQWLEVSTIASNLLSNDNLGGEGGYNGDKSWWAPNPSYYLDVNYIKADGTGNAKQYRHGDLEAGVRPAIILNNMYIDVNPIYDNNQSNHAMSKLVYDENTLPGNSISTVSVSGFIPTKYEVIADTAASSDYTKFKVVDNNGRITVQVNDIKLKVGTYKFRIKASEGSFAISSADITITVNKNNQQTISFYSDASSTNKITTLDKGAFDQPFYVYVDGGADEILDSSYEYSISSDPSAVIASFKGTDAKCQITLSNKMGDAIIKAVKKGNNNYNDVETTLTLHVKEMDVTPVIEAVKTNDDSKYTTGEQYNGDVKVKFKGSSTDSESLSLKLKERDKNNYSASWNTLTAKDINNPYEVTLNLGNDEWIYKEYKLYYEGFEDKGISFIVDISNEKPIITQVSDGGEYNEKKLINLNIYPGRVPTENPCTATLNGNPYTSMAEIHNGDYVFIITDAYGNTNTVNFKVDLPGATGEFKQTKELYSNDVTTDKTVKNKLAGKVNVLSGEGPFTYKIKDAQTAAKFRIDDSGTVYIIDGVELSAGSYPVTFTILDAYKTQSEVSGEIKVEKGTQENFRYVDINSQDMPNIDGVYEAIEETYDKENIQLFVMGNIGKVTYKLKETSVVENGKTIDLSDVIEVDKTSGNLAIKNASLADQLGRIIVVATAASTSDYELKSIEIPVNILKAAQEKFAFKFKEKTVQAGKGSFKPEFINGLSDGKVKLTSTDALVTVTGTNSDTFHYNISDKKDVILKAQKAGNRNYEDSPIVMMTLHVMEKGQTLFDVNVKAQDTSTNKVYYGDTSAKFVPIDPEANATFKYKSQDETIASMSGDDTFIPKKAGTVTFEITKSIPGENDIVITKDVIIYPKPITITIDDKEMLKGEIVPAFTFQVPADELIHLDTITNILMSCKDGSSMVDSSTPKGTYSIKGTYTKSDYPNYDIKIKDGTLTIDQETPLDIWYELFGTLGNNGWYTSDVDVSIATGATDKDYTMISGDQAVWADKFIISTEGDNKFSAYFKKDSGAVSFGIDGEVKIDTLAPKIKSIQAKDSNNSIESLINTLTFNAFFKKGTDILIQGDDTNGATKVSGVKEAAYTIQKLDDNYNPDGSPITGSAVADSTGLMKVTMDDASTYQVCALLKDNAGNEMDKEQCVQVSIKDPQKDFDSNNDGCPDLNVTLGSGSPVLNIDKNLDGIPELNIDTNGDGKADINIDSDDDGKPDVNLVILKDWKPSVCTTDQQHNYGYQPNIEAKINIAKDNKKAELNIDWDGDMKADLNIDSNHDGKADVNIGKIHTWIPEQDYQYVGFDYDTIKKNSIVLALNIDTDGDGLPDVNLDLNDDGIPELNIDNTGDMLPNIDIDSDGDGVADINIDENGDGKADKNITTIKEWKPEKNCDKEGFKYDTMGDLVPDMKPDPQPNPKPDDPDNNDELDKLIHDDTQIEVTIKGNKHFKSSMKLVVDDITDIIGNVDYGKIMKDASSSQDVKKVFNARLIEDNIVVQPDGTIEVKIPITNDLKTIKNLSILLEKSDGTYEKVDFKAVNGYYVFTTDYLGKISIIGDKEKTASPNDDSETSVKGAYKNKVYGSGGVNTGDETNIYFLFILMIITTSILITYYKKNYRDN